MANGKRMTNILFGRVQEGLLRARRVFRWCSRIAYIMRAAPLILNRFRARKVVLGSGIVTKKIRKIQPRRAMHMGMAVFVVASVIIPCFNFDTVEAASVGPRYATAIGDCVDDATNGGTIAWTNPGNAFSSNSTYATAALGTATTHYVKCTNFGFTLPNAQIKGITVSIQRMASAASRIYDRQVRIVKGGVVGTTDRSNATAWGTTNVVQAYGSTSDTWGESWTYTDINAATFGAAMSATRSAGGSTTASVDSIAITVEYVPLTNLEQSGYRWFNNQDATTQHSFAKTWGGTGNDYGQFLIQTTDGGYAVAGTTISYSAGGFDMLLAKYDASWNIAGCSAKMCQSPTATVTSPTATTASPIATEQWLVVKGTFAKTWNATGSSDQGSSLVQTTDGGYAVTGYISGYGSGGYDMFLAKYDAAGTLSWSKTWGGTNSDLGFSLVQTTDGGYAVTGQTTSYSDTAFGDMFLAKYDSTGTLSWSKTWGGIYNGDSGNSIIQTTDGGYAITGTSYSYGDNNYGDMFIAKYDSTGTLSWSKTWGEGSAYDRGYSIVQTADGGYVTTGMSDSSGYPAFIVKYSPVGSVEWSKELGSAGTSYGQSIVQTGDTGYAVVGYTSGSGAGGDDVFIAKYSSAGNIIGCASSLCHDATTQTITSLTDASARASFSATVTSPTAIVTSPTVTDTFQVSKAIWGEKVPIPSTPLADQNIAAKITRRDTLMRLRIALQTATGKAAVPTYVNLKLQVAAKVGTCDASFIGETYVDLASTSAFNFYDNMDLTDNTWARKGPLDLTVSSGTLWYENYEEAAGFTNRHYLKAGDSGLWDVALTANSETLGGTYCFRIVQNDGSPLVNYSYVPELSIPPAMSQRMRHGQWFDVSGVKQPLFW